MKYEECMLTANTHKFYLENITSKGTGSNLKQLMQVQNQLNGAKELSYSAIVSRGTPALRVPNFGLLAETLYGTYFMIVQ